MKIVTSEIRVRSATGPDVVDITPNVEEIVGNSGIETGILQATVLGSTASLTTIEYEPGVIEDLKRAVSRLAPIGVSYEHDQAWGDGNGYSHVQAALLGPSLSLAVRQGCSALGTWQQIVVINHDCKPRERHILITIIGQ